jgi:hypothetical protein
LSYELGKEMTRGKMQGRPSSEKIFYFTFFAVKSFFSTLLFGCSSVARQYFARRAITVSPRARRPGDHTRYKLVVLGVLWLVLCSGGAFTQDEVQPTNELPNPYQTTAPWGRLPEGRTWGALNAVGIDNDGESVWVADRCGANPDTPPGASAVLW